MLSFDQLNLKFTNNVKKNKKENKKGTTAAIIQMSDQLIDSILGDTIRNHKTSNIQFHPGAIDNHESFASSKSPIN